MSPSNQKKSKSESKPKPKSKSKVKVKRKAGRSRSKNKKHSVRSRLKGVFFHRRTIISLFSILSLFFFIYITFLNQKITERFEGSIWQLPAHVYARPLEIYLGKSISVQQLVFELEYLNYQKINDPPHDAAQYRHWKSTFEIKTRAFTFWDGIEPEHTVRVTIDDNKVAGLTDIYGNKSVDLIRFDAGYLTGIFPSHSQDRILLKIEDVPDMFIKMLLLIEDRRFFTHWGVDPRSIARALLVNFYSGGTVQGGSTLTQQLVKNLFLSKEKKLIRKINEAFMSLMLEYHYDKKLILETYLNEIYLGQDGRRAIHGFGLASEFYFGKKLKDLSIDEMAILIGMVKGASYYNPKRNPGHAKQRRDIVLASMQKNELITQRQKEKLSVRPVKTVKHARSGLYPAFIDAVKHQLQQDYQPEDLRSEGLRVFTTLDPFIQYKAENAIKTVLPELSKDEKLQAAAVVVSPSSGDVLAVVGDRKSSFKGYNRALNAHRQIGSLIKPVVYLAALEKKSGYTLATMLDDSALIFTQKGQSDWKPKNYDREYHGDVTLYESLLKSYNVPAVRTALDIGLDDVVDTLYALGINRNIDAYPSLALGAVTMTPMEVASIYQSLAANGFYSPLRSVTAVLDKNQQPLGRYSIDVDSRISAESVAIINSALIDVTKYGTARGLSDGLDIQVAGKTGTSDDLRDSWFAGFSADLVAVVWTGYDNNQSTRLTGSSGAMKIWQKLFQAVAYESYQPPMMSTIEKHWIDVKNGLLAEKSCENAVELAFIKGTEPRQESDCSAQSGSNWFLELFN